MSEAVIVASQPSGVPLMPQSLPACLGFVAGIVDVTSWLTLGGLFTAHITGNIVVMAAAGFNGRAMHPTQLLAIAMFIIVASILAVIVRRTRMEAGSIQDALLVLQSILLTFAALVAFTTRPSLAPLAADAGIVAMLAVAAMASQNALLHLSTKPSPTTAVMTGNIVACTLSLVSIVMYRPSDYDAARKQWHDTWPVLAGFVLGCIAGSAFVHVWKDGAWIAAAVASIASAVWIRTVRRPS
jgi:uncharacterized membrane protein YoaK (UPF0700 family)